MADTPIGETVPSAEPKNEVKPTVTPPVEKTVDNAEVERLRREAEQATMRANQLANQLKAKEDAEAAAQAKELEEQNKFKDLYEQEKAKLEQIESAQEEAERKAEIKAKTDELFKDYPDSVKELADDFGVQLADTDEDTVAEFKAKLDKIKPKVANQKVTANNPGVTTPTTQLSQQDFHEIMQDPKKFQEYVQKNTKGIAAMTKPAE